MKKVIINKKKKFYTVNYILYIILILLTITVFYLSCKCSNELYKSSFMNIGYSLVASVFVAFITEFASCIRNNKIIMLQQSQALEDLQKNFDEFLLVFSEVVNQHVSNFEDKSFNEWFDEYLKKKDKLTQYYKLLIFNECKKLIKCIDDINKQKSVLIATGIMTSQNFECLNKLKRISKYIGYDAMVEKNCVRVCIEPEKIKDEISNIIDNTAFFNKFKNYKYHAIIGILHGEVLIDEYLKKMEETENEQ